MTWQSGYTPYTLKTKKFLRLTRVRNPVDGGGGSVGFGQTQCLTKVASLPSFCLRAAPPRRRLAACAAARLTQAGPRVERAGQPALGARASPVGAGAAWMSAHGAPGFPRSLREPPRPSPAVDVRRRRGARRAAPGLLSARGGRGGPSESPAARGGSCAAATSAAISPVWLARGGSPRRFAGSAVRSCRRRSR